MLEVKKILWPTLYLSTSPFEVSHVTIAEQMAQHPHINFDKNNIAILNRANDQAMPLTYIASLTATNPQKNKNAFLY